MDRFKFSMLKQAGQEMLLGYILVILDRFFEAMSKCEWIDSNWIEKFYQTFKI